MAEVWWERKTYKTIDGQSGKTLTIDKCTDADYVSYRAKIQISVGECLYTSFEKTIQLVENPPYSVNNKTGYGKNAEKNDADGKYYSQYSLSNNVVPGDTDNMTVDVKADTGYSLTYTWYEYKDGKWNEITDAKTNVYSKKFETADFDSTTSKQYKCKVTASMVLLHMTSHLLFSLKTEILKCTRIIQMLSMEVHQDLMQKTMHLKQQ